jgi:hypothetical protein
VKVPRPFGLSCRERLALVDPAEGFGKRFVEEVDERTDALLKICHGCEVATAQNLACQDGEPQLDLIEPGGMLGGEVKDDAMARIAEEGAARGHRLEDAAAVFDAEVTVKADGLGDEAHDRLGAVDVEVVHDQVPRGVGWALGEQRGEVSGEILMRASRAELIEDLTGDHAEGGDQGEGAVTDVLELLPLDASGTQGLRRGGARKRVQPRNWMRENRTSGTVAGAPGNRSPYAGDRY